MTGDAFALMQTFDHAGGDTHFDHFPDQLMGHAVVMALGHPVALDIDVVIEGLA